MRRSRWSTRAIVRMTLVFVSAAGVFQAAAFVVPPLVGGVHRASPFQVQTDAETFAGYSNQPIDQPLPFPAFHPEGDPEGGCEWIADAMPALSALQLTQWKRPPMVPMCQLWGEEALPYAVQVRVFGSYHPLDTASQLDPITVAGLHGHRYVLDDTDKTFCSVRMDLRAYATLEIDAFDFDQYNPTSEDNKANCAVAEQVADILLRRYSPLAGGTPWPDTPQQPDGETLDNLKPCGFIQDTIYTDIPLETRPERGGTRVGETCTYRDRRGTLETLIAAGAGGLDAFPPRFTEPPNRRGSLALEHGLLDPRETRQRDRENVKFGGYFRSREEYTPAGDKHTQRSCMVAIETDGDNHAGRVIAVTYTSVRTVEDNCAIARIMMANGIRDAMIR